ncbi:MAG: MBL fold metallo-hydrolase [Sphingobacteriaceae bacterium]|nr:MAG: MBL fold metallo-hydrolase [Sphingobacteriaceae bacterium]
MVKLIVIGCGDAFASGALHNTCFYVQSAKGCFLIDCGASAVHGLKQQNIKLNKIDTILITHFHGDHYGGVPFLLLEMAVYKRKKPITIVTPPGGRENISALLHLLYPGSKVLENLNIKFIEYNSDEEIYVNYITLKAFAVIHTPEAMPHGLRISVDDRIISYSGDTEWTDSLFELSQYADLFICECNFFSTQVKNHMNYQALKIKLPLLQCEKLLLTHFDNEMLQNMSAVVVPCAKEGMVVEL